MAGKITLNKYQMLGFNGWAGMTTDNHLSALFQSEPQRASDVIVMEYKDLSTCSKTDFLIH